MKLAHRLAAWIALLLVVAVTLGPGVAPVLEASLADVAEVCAPSPAQSAPATASASTARERIPLRVPRCGVA